MAATLTQARTALRDRLVAYFLSQGSSVQVYATVPGAVVAPAVVIEPGAGSYHPTHGAAGVEHVLSAHATVALGDREAAQNLLDQMVSTDGPFSIIAAIHEDKTLGGVVRWSDPVGYHDYGTREFSGVQYLMVTVDVRVLCHP